MNPTPLQPQTEQQQEQQQQQYKPSDMLDAMVNSGDHIHYHKITLRGRKWRYRGEGNANLVIALPQREIVRLRKAERAHALQEGCNEQAENAEREHVCREVLFCRHVMVPLLGACYLQPPAAARLDSSEVRQLSTSLQSQRPAHRHHKDVLCSGGYATLYPDYALLPASLASSDPEIPTFCVEVKPKQGWIPQLDRLPKCTYCMKQFLKLKNKCIARRSAYCPLDLFSGDSPRMLSALQALLVSPQNNLKIFKNGVLVYGEDVGNYETLFEVLGSWFGSPNNPIDEYRLITKFCSLVLEALTRDLSDGKLVPFPAPIPVSPSFQPQILSPSSYSPKKMGKNDTQSSIYATAASIVQPPCDWNTQTLPVNCVLDRVLRVQSLEQPSKDWELPTSPRAKRDFAYVGSVICDPGTYQSPLHRYLLAATAKDCSILLAFQSVNAERAISLPVRHIAEQAGGGQLFVFNVGVSDLDPKPISCIEKHCKRDMEMLLAGIELTALQKEKLGHEKDKPTSKFC